MSPPLGRHPALDAPSSHRRDQQHVPCQSNATRTRDTLIALDRRHCTAYTQPIPFSEGVRPCKERENRYRFLALAILVAAALACGGTNTGAKVGTAVPGTTAQPQKQQTFKVGDVVDVGDHKITLNEVNLPGGTLTANFTVENTGNKDVIISSLVSFNAKDAEGTKLEYAMCDSAQLDGKVLPGDRSKGNIRWKGVTSTKGVKIYYEPQLFGSGAIVWELE